VFSVTIDLRIQSAEHTVFEALTNQNLLSRWFAPQVIAVPVEGTIAAFAFEFDLNLKMELVSLKEDKLVHWKCVDGYKEWLESEVVFNLEKVGGSTHLRFKHSNLTNEEKRDRTIKSWNEYLEKLKKICEAEVIKK